MKVKFTIAIDGPVGVGKGTLAVGLAKKFGALYVNTGAMYRALTLLCLRKKIDIKNEEEVLRNFKNSTIELQIDTYSNQKIFLNGEDVSREIFLPEVTNTVALISPFPSVRKEMVRRQRQLAKNGIDSTFEEILAETAERDKRDTQRRASPLTITEDAYVLDTTNLSIDETVEKVIKKMREK